MRCNDNVFVYNRMLGYNTSFYDVDTNDWYWDEVQSQAATCYIKFGEQHFEYIQPLRPDNASLKKKDNEIILSIAKKFQQLKF